MISHLHGKGAPFELVDRIVYFHDWRYVYHGGYRWVDEKGEGISLWGMEEMPGAYYQHLDQPCGVELVAERGEKTEPVLTAEIAGVSFLSGANIIYDEGIYRLWYEQVPVLSVQARTAGHTNNLRYAESDDGFNWRFPSPGLIEDEESPHRNIVYGHPLNERFGFHGGCVFKDPSAPPSERYKLFFLGFLEAQQLDEYRKKRPHEIDPAALRCGGGVAVCGAVSPDGLHWETLPEPLLVQHSDTHNVCEYDPVRGTYVAYVRSWFLGRRTIGRTESDDFRRFPLPEEVFWPDASVKPSELWYANAKTRMPQTLTYHLMFPERWDVFEDRFDFHLATSPDNVVWGLVPGGAVCEPGAPSEWDGGVVTPGLGLVILPANRIGIMFSGASIPHKHPRRPPLGAFGWCLWREGRLVALRANQKGSFTLFPLFVEGRTVHLNHSTRLTGYIKVEVAGEKGEPVPDRSFEDCDIIRGDEFDRVVTWRGESHIKIPEGQRVQLRFQLCSSSLYSVRFE